MNIIKYDKVVLKKEYNNLKKVGGVFEIANITDTSYTLRDSKTRVAVASVDIDLLDEYFEKLDDYSSWTSWTKFEAEDNEIVFYRTNRKKVQVKMFYGEKIFKGESNCNLKEKDEFNLYFGLTLAYSRCLIKKLKSIKEEYKNKIEKLDYSINYSRIVINNMVLSSNKD